MADTFTLAAETREQAKKSARETRSSGRIPGVLYGSGVESQGVSVDYSEFLRLFRKAGQSSLVDLNLGGKAHKVLIHTYDQHPVKDTVDHIDFMAVNLKEKVVVHVPLIFTGESPAVKNLGAVFVSNMSELEIRCLPTDIPHDITVDIASLANMHDHITVADLNLDANLELLHTEETAVIASVTGQGAAESEEESETPETEVAGEKAEEEEASQ